MSIDINRWQPSVPTGDSCAQVVAFQLTALDDAAVIGSRVDLMSDGIVIGSTQVDTTGESSVSGQCAPDNDLRHVSLALVGPSGLVTATATSPDRCRRDREELTPEAWSWLVGPQRPRAVWPCLLTRTTGIRFPSGRSVVEFSGITVSDARKVVTAGSLEFDAEQQPMAPTGRIVLRVDGERLLSRPARIGRRYSYPVHLRSLRPGTHRLVVHYLGDARWEPLDLVVTTIVVPRH